MWTEKLVIPLILAVLVGGAAPWWIDLLKNSEFATPTPTPTTISISSKLNDDNFEVMKEVTIRAWNDLQDADEKISQIKIDEKFDESIDEIFNEKIEFNEKSKNFYKKIDLTNVDPLLSTHIKNLIHFHEELINFYQKAKEEVNEIALISNYSRRMSKFDLFEKKLEKATEYFQERNISLNTRDKELADKFTEKYDVGFNDRF